MLNKVLAVSALAASVLAVPVQLPDTSSLDLVALLNQTAGFSYLSEHVGQIPALAGALNNLTNITVLAPSNIALRLFPWDTRYYEEWELASVDLLQAILGYHILDGVHTNLSTSFAPYKTAVKQEPWTTVPGGQVVLGRFDTRTFETAFVSGRGLLTQAPTFMKFKGGIIYAIDDVLNLPRGVAYELNNKAANATNFIAALGRAGLLDEVESLGQVTIFAPNDEAFRQVEKAFYGLSKADQAAVLQYHIIPNQITYSSEFKNGTTFKTLGDQDIKINKQRRNFIQNARVLGNDVPIKNGVVHVIDNVMNPKVTPEAQNATQGDGEPAFPLGPGFF
ncbi:uncharacterized protein A1O9_10425 [Exophiala aquamarina CBS 119918]|uniref:FAS1 domain-containing protein n=1 Tax=Exophiala aquamarina CBS 119918 TaxID=1182545 RepID=A0A072PD08_9EURO|nr:uncharacterized protein A1O9_10425 [Exophiala aquamarina CBS 119918]KEF53450.1 hypothetical protein A1O9_10425 [Exophiala aquamarina CBS 119918]